MKELSCSLCVPSKILFIINTIQLINTEEGCKTYNSTAMP